jgi:anti-sigma factor RsiW
MAGGGTRVIGLRCIRQRAALVDFADGIVEEPTRASVERHLSACRHCAETVLALREVPAELGRRIRSAPDERFWAEQLRRIGAAIDRGVVPDVAARPAIRRRTLTFWPALPALAAAAGLLAVLGRSWIPAPAPQIVALPVVAGTFDESLAAFVDEPATVATVDTASLEDATIAGIDESLRDTLVGYSDGNLI